MLCVFQAESDLHQCLADWVEFEAMLDKCSQKVQKADVELRGLQPVDTLPEKQANLNKVKVSAIYYLVDGTCKKFGS